MDVIHRWVLFIAILMVIHIPSNSGSPIPSEISLTDASDFDLIYNETLVIPEGETLVWRNESVSIADSIRIEGTLEAYNTTILFGIENATEVTIIVNGTMIISDHDGDPATTGDASELIGSTQTTNTITTERTSCGLYINNSRIRSFVFDSVPVHIRGTNLTDCRIVSPGTASTFELMHMETTWLGTGILLDKAYLWQIHSINITGYKVGIRLFAGELRLYRSSIFESITGITVDPGTEATLTDCIIERSAGPIEAYGNITLIGTTVINGRIRFHDSTGYLHNSKFINLTTLIGIKGGVVRNSTFDRCRTALEESVETLIIRNRIENSVIGISDPTDCIIYHNVFKGNTFHVDGSIQSTWYNETYLEGNYWSSYNGLDDGSGGRRENDGIGDTNIPFLGRDYYPLMMEDYVLRPSIPEITLDYTEGTSTVYLHFIVSGDGHYIVQRSSDADFLTDITSWSTPDRDLAVASNPNSTLHFRVGSFNHYGSRGWSVPAEVTINDRPVPPVKITAEPMIEGNIVNVSWTYEGEDVHEIIIRIRNVPENTDLPSRNTYHPLNWHIIEDLENNVQYEFRLVAVDGSGHQSLPSEGVRAVPMDLYPPPPPKAITATPLSNESISLEWAPSSIQDLDGFIIYRKDPGSPEFVEIARTGWNGYSYTDTNLKDNTTYEYGIRSMDSDGPLSVMVGPISVRTEHNNNVPEMIVKNIGIELVEDEGPGSLDLRGIFRDDDGDEINIEISDTHLFAAEIRGYHLWVFPEPDQEGTGYVQLLVSDGEAAVPYYIGVFVQARPDSPRDVKILNPVNGSILTPGLVHQLQGYAYDPDRDDFLTVSWSSDRGGLLTPSVVIGSINNLFTSHVLLSPGIHRLTLAVWDSTMGYSYDNSTVAVSLWGFSPIPWNLSLDGESTNLTTAGGVLRLEITNSGPILLTFICNATVYRGSSNPLPLGERIIVLQPETTGTILFNLNIPLPEGETVSIKFKARAETFNGTYAGEDTLEVQLTVESRTDENDRLDLILLLFGIILMVLIVIATAFVYFQFRRKDDLRDLEGVK